MQVVPVVPWSMARIIGRTLSGAAPHCVPDVLELPRAMEEAGRGPARRSVVERQLDLLDAKSRPQRVDRHPGLEPPATGERDQVSQGRDAHRALSREWRLERGSGQPLKGPARISDREAESAPVGLGEPRQRELTFTSLDRLDER